MAAICWGSAVYLMMTICAIETKPEENSATIGPVLFLRKSRAWVNTSGEGNSFALISSSLNENFLLCSLLGVP